METIEGEVFFSEMVEGGFGMLSPEESRHCLNVLRHGRGDTVNLFDRYGKIYTAKITDTNPKKCVMEIIDERDAPKRNRFLHVAIAPTKNADRLEWFVEKAVETGIEEITPILCSRSERRILKIERLEKIVVAAMKQSLNLNFPKINQPIEFDDFVNMKFDGKKCIAHCGEKTRTFVETIASDKSVLILIGPEGDFSPAEIEKTKLLGYTPVTLGRSRLRTETAGIVACITANLRDFENDFADVEVSEL